MFKKNEGLAKKVMDILLTDFSNKDRLGNIEDSEYLDIIKWSLEDYESCGFNMKSFRTYYNILIIQKERQAVTN